jgi:hypothetical protein
MLWFQAATGRSSAVGHVVPIRIDRPWVPAGALKMHHGSMLRREDGMIAESWPLEGDGRRTQRVEETKRVSRTRGY